VTAFFSMVRCLLQVIEKMQTVLRVFRVCSLAAGGAVTDPLIQQ
jgi:hypothetical protein